MLNYSISYLVAFVIQTNRKFTSRQFKSIATPADRELTKWQFSAFALQLNYKASFQFKNLLWKIAGKS
jgi:hypothetical protein